MEVLALAGGVGQSPVNDCLLCLRLRWGALVLILHAPKWFISWFSLCVCVCVCVCVLQRWHLCEADHTAPRKDPRPSSWYVSEKEHWARGQIWPLLPATPSLAGSPWTNHFPLWLLAFSIVKSGDYTVDVFDILFVLLNRHPLHGWNMFDLFVWGHPLFGVGRGWHLIEDNIPLFIRCLRTFSLESYTVCTGTPRPTVLLYTAQMVALVCLLFRNWRQNPPTADRLWLTLLPWSGTEPAVSLRESCTPEAASLLGADTEPE